MLALVCLIPLAIGMVIGLTRIIAGRIPLIMAGLAIIVSVLLVAWIGAWAAACPHCGVGWEDTRESMFGVYLVLVGIALASLVAGIAVGALIASPIVHWRRNRSQPT